MNLTIYHDPSITGLTLLYRVIVSVETIQVHSLPFLVCNSLSQAEFF